MRAPALLLACALLAGCGQADYRCAKLDGQHVNGGVQGYGCDAGALVCYDGLWRCDGRCWVAVTKCAGGPCFEEGDSGFGYCRVPAP